MRTIKFRGKCFDGKWVHSGNIRFKNDGSILIHTYSISPETLGQFVGIQDENRRDIYEGDIIEKTVRSGCSYSYIGIVVFSNGFFGIKGISDLVPPLSLFKQDALLDDKGDRVDVIYKYKVIGNIFDNPELLANHQ